MNATASVKMGRLQDPQIVRVEMAGWHRVLNVAAPIEIECLELCTVLFARLYGLD